MTLLAELGSLQFDPECPECGQEACNQCGECSNRECNSHSCSCIGQEDEELDVTDDKFNKFSDDTQKQEGIVLIGIDNPSEWIDGVAKMWHDEGISPTADPSQIWKAAIRLQTTRGRTDLGLIFKPGANLNIGKMAIWRIRFGDCSWISDYLVNYKNQHEEEEEASVICPDPISQATGGAWS